MGKKELFLEFCKVYSRNKAALFGLGIIVVLFLVAILADFIAPFQPIEQNISVRLMPPAWSEKGSLTYLLGTDDFGRDLFSRIVYGSRISLAIGAISVGFSLMIGIPLGVFAAYFGGIVDNILMRVIDIMMAIPSLLMAIVIVTILGPSLQNAMIAIAIVYIPSIARLIRGSVLAEKNKEYVIASRVNGSSSLRLIFIVILPNCLGPIIVQSTMNFAVAVVEAAGLSFLGLGAQPPKPEWGAMLVDSFEYLLKAPWMIGFPGLAIFLTVFGFNLIGDGLMDAMDPKSKEKG
ncbi:MAG: ABC transporter permease subunit [Deltaproteobacteria bacterium]|jgi:ABC-type dipeptide/oligopeptide/nickel transport system permease subunit|nr:ABC transporter permease subunit [Deltaproteobacteria bacterium]MBT4525247.1 ABC transporter permease subunit [Deltaproteobacteria bacterium]